MERNVSADRAFVPAFTLSTTGRASERPDPCGIYPSLTTNLIISPFSPVRQVRFK